MAKENSVSIRFIEQVLWWEGRINSTHLQRHFSISRQAASRQLTKYKRLYPNNIIYNSSDKAHVLTPDFKASRSLDNFFDYLATISSNSFVTNLADGQDKPNFFYEVLPPLRKIQVEQVRPILRAIRDKLKIDIGYISLSSPDYLDRFIEPHALIFDGLRWHVRAYCYKNQSFRDFTLSRFNGEAEFEGKAQICIKQDQRWQKVVELSFEADHRFSDKQKQIIANDYQMENGIKTITTRVAMLNYLLKRLHLDRYEKTPQAQQIVLTSQCQQDIQQYLF